VRSGFRAPSIACWLLGATLLTAQDGSTHNDWPSYGGDAAGTRYASTSAITTANAGRLRLAAERPVVSSAGISAQR